MIIKGTNDCVNLFIILFQYIIPFSGLVIFLIPSLRYSIIGFESTIIGIKIEAIFILFQHGEKDM